jgi:hypothetical protein
MFSKAGLKPPGLEAVRGLVLAVLQVIRTKVYQLRLAVAAPIPTDLLPLPLLLVAQQSTLLFNMLMSLLQLKINHEN